MGLLGDGWDSEQSQMIMGLAQGLLSARGGQGLAAGLGNMQAIQNNAGKNKLLNAQLANFKSEADERKAKAQEAQRINAALPGLFSQSQGMSPGAFSPSVDGMGPTAPPSMRGQQSGGGFDLQGAIASRIPFPMIKEAMALTAGPEYSPEVRYDQNGKAFMTSKNGTLKYLDGVSARDKLDEVRLGDRVGFRSPYSTEIQGSMAIGQSPDSRASNAVSMRGQNMTDSRARETMAFNQGTATAEAGGPNQTAFTKQFGKAEPGFRWKPDGTSEPIPGGSKDIKAGELGDKRDRQQQGAIQQADRIIAKVDQSLAKVGYLSAGFGGSALGVVPGSNARNLKSDLETIKANLGFAELQAMRDASPTGGALGQVAVQELTALQSTVASLDQGQSQDQLKARLGEVKKHYQNWKTAVQQSSQVGAANTGGASGSWEQTGKLSAMSSGGWSATLKK